MTEVAPRQAPWTARLFEILADRRWHDQRAVLDDVVGLVPPGVAYRVGERERIRNRRHRNGDTATTERAQGDHASAIRHGAGEKTRGSLENQITVGHIERRYRDGRPQIRLARRMPGE